MSRLRPDPQRVLRVPEAKVGLSTASVYPLGTATAFELASSLGYDGVELFVWTEQVSQDIDQVERLSERYGLPVMSVHVPCSLVTQRVWSPDPVVRLNRSIEAAQHLGAGVVVTHPPFRWQREYARDFVSLVAQSTADSGIVVAVENMYPWRVGRRQMEAYAPSWDPVDQPYEHVTLDLSHASVAGVDVLAQAEALGDRLAHVHMTDGSGSARDEHLVPGRGKQPCAELLEGLARRGWSGSVVLEVGTRKARNMAEREADLAEALAFTRLNLAAAIQKTFAVDPNGTAERVS